MATTAPTTAPVIRASPMPISTCQPTIAAVRAVRSIGTLPPTTYKPTNTSAAAGTDRKAPTTATGTTLPARRGRTLSRALATR